MASRKEKVCFFPGCNNITEHKYCTEHKKLLIHQYNQTKRNKAIQRLYGYRWRKIRASYVAIHPYCEICLSLGRKVPAREVHHIIPLSEGGTHDTENLQALCQSCHTKIHYQRHDRGKK